MVETSETMSFRKSDNGVLIFVILSSERDNWDKSKEEDFKIIEEYRGKFQYDAIVPFSGKREWHGSPTNL